jgi:hypothetical protein
MSAISPKENQAPQRTPSSTTNPNVPAHSITHQEHPILNLQRTIGNQAVLRLLEAGSLPGEAAAPSGAGAATTHPRFTDNFASIPVSHTPVRGIQRKLTVNAPGDAYEQEADRVAEQVMRMPEQQTASMPQSFGRAAGVQCECACGGSCDDCKKKNRGEEHAKVQMKAAGPVNAGGLEAPPIVHEVLRSPGRPLDAGTRAFMEPRFGQDFSGVRVHTDGKAAEAAGAVQAKAYTVGNNVVFGSGEFSPGTAEGQRLLGHELAHVVQQGNSSLATLQRQPAGDDIDDTAVLERELKSKKSERAMLARMLDELQKKSAEDAYERRIATPSKNERLGPMPDGPMDDLTRKVLQNKLKIVKTQDGYILQIHFEISYLGRNDEDGGSRARSDIPRLGKAISNAWTVHFSKGHYAGKEFRVEPQIQFRSNTSKPDVAALQMIVRRDPKGDTIGDTYHGEISINPKDIEGSDVITVAHELHHLFGWWGDTYRVPAEEQRKKHPQDPASQYLVGRPDALGRGDLFGEPRPSGLKEWRDKKLITQAQYDRQTRAPLRVWEEDADLLLYALGVAPNRNNVADPDSPAFDPQEALRQQESGSKQKLEKLQGEIDRDAETDDYIQKAERAIQLDKEIAELQRKITQRKEGAILRRPRRRP